MAQWFEYDWPLEGEEAHFAVDMELTDMQSDAWAYLSFLSCESRRSDAERLNALETARAEALKKRFLKNTSCLYAGYIESGAQRQYYFYSHEKSSGKRLSELADRERLLLSCRAGSAEEPSWVTYRSLLYPDAAKLQTERNRAHIALMQKHGDGIVSLRRVSFSLFFPTEVIMQLFTEQAKLSGFAVSGPVYEPEHELAYGVTVVRLSTLEKRDIDELTTRAIRVAEKFGGELRYWDSPVVRRGGPIMGN